MLHHCYIKPPNPTFCSSLGPWTPGGKHGRLGDEKQSIENILWSSETSLITKKNEFDVQSAKERTTLMICEESSIRKFQPKLGKGCQSQETNMFYV